MIRPGRNVRLLEVAPELAEGLPDEAREAMETQLVVPQLELEPGRWAIQDIDVAPAVRRPVLGVLVLAGTMTMEATIAGCGSAQVLGRGDVLFFGAEVPTSLPTQIGLRAHTSARLAVLDARVLLAARHWPMLIVALCARAGTQVQQGLLYQAISQLPRAEDRVLGFLWSLADRWGRMRGDGAHVSQPFSHRDLGRMVGARRPTVSIALKVLVESGALDTGDGDWRISRDSLTAFAPEEPATPRAAPRASPRLSVAPAPLDPSAAQVLSLAASLPDRDTVSVRSVGDEAAAVSALEREVPELMLIGCRGLDGEHPGVRLIRRLRDRRCSDVRCVVLRGERDVVPEGLLAIAHDYVAAPLSGDDLLARVDAQLAVAAARRRARPTTGDELSRTGS